MPEETKQAIEWALKQEVETPYGYSFPITKETTGELVEYVRVFFNENDIKYSTFSYADLVPYLED